MTSLNLWQQGLYWNIWEMCNKLYINEINIYNNSYDQINYAKAQFYWYYLLINC